MLTAKLREQANEGTRHPITKTSLFRGQYGHVSRTRVSMFNAAKRACHLSSGIERFLKGLQEKIGELSACEKADMWW